jgi:metal-dependent amidase/aminoacylase/carboxypeptidase family protein
MLPVRATSMQFRDLIIVSGTVIAMLPGASAAPIALSLFERVDSVLAANEGHFIAVRHDLHRNPETSGNEARTAGVVATRLRALGLDVRTGVGGHGVVAILRGSTPGRVIAYRADMDGVFSADPDPVEYRSVVPGVRHICGHDVHTTIGLAIAEAFAAVRNELSGTVIFVFQPAEERATGARAMLADDVFGLVRPAAIFGVHTAPMPVGQLATAPGPLMPGRDIVHFTASGRGRLQAVADSARRLLQSFGTVRPDQAFSPAPDGFVLAAVRPPRAIGDSISVGATMTIASPAARARVTATLPQLLRSLETDSVHVTVRYDEKTVAGVFNDSTLTTAAIRSARAIIGDNNVAITRDIIPAFSEDFGSFQEQIPGVFFFLGVSNPARGTRGFPHTPSYVADDGAIRVGARAMAAVLLGQLSARQ